MVRHKGQRTDKQRDATYPHAVDIPIPRDGLGQNLNRIHAAAADCQGGAEAWGHSTRLAGAAPQYWCRVGTMVEADADRIATLFISLGAVRVR
jgi:hypothetical protein